MNYLAHAYLSYGHNEILLGNMISDFVKGKEQYSFPEEVHKGILLHRAIDEFTDNHPVTKEAKEVFRPAYRLYSGAFIDVAFDHFLSSDEYIFPNDTLFDFSINTYEKLEPQSALMPHRFRHMFFYMKLENWLFGYRTRQGIYQSFGGLVKRARYLHDARPAIKIFDEHYNFLQNCFKRFWVELEAFASHKFKQLTAGI
ncbi:ACP phosphodiesterase [Niabella insulamsoli]|uniref:acyl carrier protein phosphodiesterase n=1 Tax=Niabella insulamsoli TaxID=3144874 RepID=UPI0031FC32E3